MLPHFAMKNSKAWKKPGLFGVAFLIPALAAVVALVLQIKALSIDFARAELAGVAVTGPLLDLTRDLQRYRALAHATARGAALGDDLTAPRRHLLEETLPQLPGRCAQDADKFKTGG